MTELKPITIKRFKCGFCRKIYRTTAQMCLDHEKECYKNPNRTCFVCGETGVEKSPTLDIFTLGVIPDGREEVCSACKIAKIAGGKSYIDEDYEK